MHRLPKLARYFAPLLPIVIPVLAVLAALAVGAIFLLALNVNPLKVYEKLITGAVGNTTNQAISYSQAQTIGKATPLLLVAIGVCIAFRANVLNIGVEGQVILGGLGTSAFALAFPDLPPFLLITLSLCAGFVAGMAWAAIPGVLKAWFGVNEILSTIMMNQIAAQMLIVLLTGLLRDSGAEATAANIIQTAELPKAAWLPAIVPRTYFHSGAILAVILAFAATFFLWRTVMGYRIRATGLNPAAARYAGIPTRRMMLLAITLSGGFAGLAGGVEVLGVTHRTIQDFSTGYGFSGIVVALFGALHPVAAIPASLLFGGLVVSGTKLQSVGISSAMVTVLEGLIVLFVVSSSEIARRARRQRQSLEPPHRTGEAPAPAAEIAAAKDTPETGQVTEAYS